MVLGAAPQERHEIGVCDHGLFLRRRGLRVIYLGAEVSTDAALEACRLRPDVFCLSAARRRRRRRCAVAAALATLDEPVPRLGFGGRAFLDDPSLAGDRGDLPGDDAPRPP